MSLASVRKAGAALFIGLLTAEKVYSQTWWVFDILTKHSRFLPCFLARCGKNYMASSPIVPPGGQFPTPATASGPLVAFACNQAIRPYLPEDAASPAEFIIDTPLTHTHVANAQSIDIPAHGALGNLHVTINVNGHLLATQDVPLNASKVPVSFSLKGLKPQTQPLNVSCAATYSAATGKTQHFAASSSLFYLPDPPSGRSVTKMDLRTGALLAKPATGKGGPYETVLPIGFYTDFGGYLETNLTVLDELKTQG
jgi:hypothetical protein